MEKDKKIIIGIDTSCYTTSIAAISLDREVLFNKKIMLKVDNGVKGLRQSEMVFQHVNNLGILSEEIKAINEKYNVRAICASNKPRPIENSYMPVFNVGYNFSKMFSCLNNINLYETTHQENHIEASLYNKNLKSNKFISIHMSGGTTEILLIQKNKKDYSIKIVGGTKDISFGQLVDRLGVSLGYDFPCGKYIDENAIKCNIDINEGLKTSVKDGYMNLSGLENQINKSIKDYDKYYLSKLLMDAIVRSIYKSIIYICNKEQVRDVVFAGGVASSQYIENQITKKLIPKKINCYFNDVQYSTDNAVGCALIGLNKFIGE
ncbi:MAG: O-sialoglycoprotein endopeptidase [Paraclostridium sp.]